MVELGGNMKPYLDIKYRKGSFIRVFFPWLKEKELVWHRDKEDRSVTALFNFSWKFQFDNELPFLLKREIFIQKETFHRLIKGKGLLVLKIKE